MNHEEMMKSAQRIADEYRTLLEKYNSWEVGSLGALLMASGVAIGEMQTTGVDCEGTVMLAYTENLKILRGEVKAVKREKDARSTKQESHHEAAMDLVNTILKGIPVK